MSYRLLSIPKVISFKIEDQGDNGIHAISTDGTSDIASKDLNGLLDYIPSVLDRIYSEIAKESVKILKVETAQKDLHSFLIIRESDLKNAIT